MPTITPSSSIRIQTISASKPLMMKNIFGFSIAATVCFFLYNYLYNTILFEIYYYMGFNKFPVGSERIIIPILIALSPIALLTRNRVASFVLALNILFILIPTGVCAWNGASSIYVFYITFISSAVIAITASYSGKAKITPVYQSSLDYSLIILLSIFSLIMITLAISGTRFLNFSLADVYEFRNQARESLPTAFEYMRSTATSALLPIGLALALRDNRKMLILGYAISALFLFALSSHKAIIFSFLFLIITYYSFRFKYRASTVWLASFLGLAVLFYVENSLMRGGTIDGNFLGDAILRRTIFTPALLNGYYVDFFSHNPMFYWSNSKITLGLIPQPYNISPPYVIGGFVFNDFTLSANTGLVGSGFSNAGVVGVLIYSVSVGVILAYLNFCDNEPSGSIMCTFFGMLFHAIFRDTDIVTVLLNHGLLIFLGLVLLVSRHPYRRRSLG